MINFFKALIVVSREGPEKIEKLKEEAKTDFLTGLLNRRGFQERIEIEKERSERYGHPFLVVYIDMDNLKKINDSKGHHAGDEALISLAENIKKNAVQWILPDELVETSLLLFFQKLVKMK
jgi:GGDEF domain-containing protein